MFHHLELVAYSQHSFPLLYHIIHFPMKKEKRWVRKEYYLILAAIVLPLNIAQTYESIFIQSLGLI
jgi:hypothetical protein